MDLDTFITTLYVLIDDWYKTHIEKKPKMCGAKPVMSDSEVLTVAIAGQWQVGVPWRSERGVVRYMEAHGRVWFPRMLKRSAFNRRVRQLLGVLVRLQQIVAECLSSEDESYESIDCFPLEAFSAGQAQREKGHWMWESSLGHGGNHGGWFWGDKLLASVRPSGAITGWVVGSGRLNDRWLMEGFISSRNGHPCVVGPPVDTRQPKSQRPSLPDAHLGAFFAAGEGNLRPYLADRGFNGERWRCHWLSSYQADVITIPPANAPQAQHWSRADKRWHAHHRQAIETAFAFLDTVFGLKHLHAHSRWGQYTRIAAKTTAYNIALFLNRSLGRQPNAMATLIC